MTLQTNLPSSTMPGSGGETLPVWSDPSVGTATRVKALMAEMTLREKVAQLFGVWVGASAEGGEVAPHQHDMEDGVDLDAILPDGLGQLTRPFGTNPVDPALGALSLLRTQERVRSANRFGIPALAHEECLAGFSAWGATAYPVPLSWGASFDPALVRRMAAAIGRDMRSVGVHQGLAPVLDVVRDARWGRVEETIGEDPYLVGTVATAYVQGLESAGIVATLKHFAGYSASRGGRNHAPVSMGARERADVILPPFEMAVREGGVRSVMHAYTDTDGIPSAADRELLTGLLRDTWGFDGTVVADYFGIAFLKIMHGVAGDWAEAAAAALAAGVDVELPTVKTFGEPLVAALEAGDVDVALVDRALERVLRQKVELGLLDADWDPVPAVLRDVPGEVLAAVAGAGDEVAVAALRGTVDLDTPANRALAREVAEQAVVLLANDGVLPLGPGVGRIALVGPTAEDPMAVLGCYSFPAHVGLAHPEIPLGISLPTLAASLRAELPGVALDVLPAITLDGTADPSSAGAVSTAEVAAADRAGIAAAVELAREADVVVVALGDRAGLFGRGTSGEGCDAESLRLPGAQQDLLDALLATGRPVVATILSGRPYALGAAATTAPGEPGAAAIVQAFFAGEEGTPAVAGVLSGRVAPSGRLPVSVPGTEGAQPTSYLAATLAQATDVSNIDPTAAFAFGHGLTYTTFEWSDLVVSVAEAATDGSFEASFVVRNTGGRDGVEVVQLYAHDPVASVVRPVQRLVGYLRVPLAAGASARVSATVPADVLSFTGRDGRRIVEPGAIELRFGASSADVRLVAPVSLVGDVRVVDHTRELHAPLVVG
ncbi:beta-glucosidase [Oerskovia sp. NPDC057915]|uniref:beta-xylosidase/alpha-l-arabinosidase n=1 Tax=Oerskovia sp. NPDC057915 TaxID=3346280 RepID=UPI0036DF302A